MKLNKTNFVGNKIKRLLLAESESQIYTDNVTFTNNHVSFEFFSISKESKLEMYSAEFLQNNPSKFLYLSPSDSIIRNSALLENNFLSAACLIMKSSTIQLNYVTVTRNEFLVLLFISSNSSAIIQNSTLLENNFLLTVYDMEEGITIQLINVAFIQNILRSYLLVMLSSSSAKLINNEVVGNRFHQICFAHSSFLEIDTIVIKNNTFSQLFRVVECNVSFESMKIRENNAINDMIDAENSAGRMANTYIENSGNLLSSAIKTTWTDLGNRYFPFEITSTDIIWKNEVPVSSRPIIHLSGNVSLSNVKLLVTSQFETEILQYSTKNIVLSVNGALISSPNIYIISSLFIGCTKASVKHITRAGSFRCIPCARGTYTLNNEYLNTSLSFGSKKIKKNEETNFTCLDCPVGANCTTSIKSKSNFYWSKTKEQKLTFLPCPRGFCCTGNQCNTIKGCNKNRVGTLCGRCNESYMESFLSADCISIQSCQNFTRFWLLYCIYALILAIFLYYMKGFITLIKTTARNSCKKLKVLQKRTR